MTRDTNYATELASAEINYCRIERLKIKESHQVEIRFAWWPEGRMANRPLDLPEHELLALFSKAIKNGVFSDSFLTGLHSALYEARGASTKAEGA
ncbi:MAG TPA: hypothetical protein VFE60_06380 [Roseiarcus sp.]|jgi:hypothetical protein|nr:hypothetical protein [Roseiarcus sp.]